ncbi:ATP-dependent metallopeptidase FtsH/Yme1/Tma family protein, partial [Campylobacter jejuni]|nr:ATP-dependent metallopeptidase FtsH/Yme1/Tma family protein [Campylobacter jejuni]
YYFDIGFEKITLIEDRFKEYEHNIRSKSELINRIKVYLAGSRAMRLIYNESYTNSQDDFLKIKELLDYMLSFDMLKESNLSEQKKEMDEFLNSMKDKILKLSELLLEKEKIEYDDVKDIMQV